MFFKSIRFKVILLYMCLLTVTLLAFSFLLYGGFSKTLYGDFDDLLTSRADGIANSINTYWQAKKMGLLPDEKSKEASSEVDANNFLTIARNWVEEKRKDPELMSIFAAILDTKGERLVSSRIMPRLPPIDKEDLEEILDKEDLFDRVKGESPDGKKMIFRVYTKPVVEDDRVVYIVQVAGPTNLVSLALKNLIVILFVLLPLTVLLAGIPGVILVRLALKPVDTMINTLRHITAENLKLRIHLPDTKDEIKRLADTFNDMIERLDRTFSSQQRFIQNIANELKTPMNILKDEMDGMLSRSCSPEECKTFLKKASEEMDTFSGIMENLLILSRFDSNRMAMEIKKIDLDRLFEHVLNGMKKESEERDVAISFSCPNKIILDGDEDQLKQLFRNLLDNALKYTYRKGKVDVTALKDPRYAKITITDTGVGIPDDEIPYIFDRFYQVTKSSRKVNHSFGLGLSSAKSIVDAHKGSITVESQVGEGSTFTVTLPLSYTG